MGAERKTVYHDDHGTMVRLDFDQVGWRGATGGFYRLDHVPTREDEPGSFSPVWVIAHSDRVVELLPDGVRAGDGEQG